MTDSEKMTEKELARVINGVRSSLSQKRRTLDACRRRIEHYETEIAEYEEVVSKLVQIRDSKKASRKCKLPGKGTNIEQAKRLIADSDE